MVSLRVNDHGHAVSLQDDIFDVEGAIKGIPPAVWAEYGYNKDGVLRAFDRLMAAWNAEAKELEDAIKYRRAVHTFARLVKEAIILDPK